MDYIIVFLVAFTIQIAFNWISGKIDYTYSNSYKWSAIGINIVVWLFLFERFDWSITFCLLAVASTILISSSFIDLTYQEIPNSYNVGVAILGIGFILVYKEFYQELLLGSFIVFVLFLFIMILTGAMGGGDVKMAGAIGLFMGTALITKFIVYSFFSGALIAILLLIIKRKGKTDVFPFGPCIALTGIYLFISFV